MEKNVDKKNGRLKKRGQWSDLYYFYCVYISHKIVYIHAAWVWLSRKMASLASNRPQGFDKAIAACNHLPEDILVEMVRTLYDNSR